MSTNSSEQHFGIRFLVLILLIPRSPYLLLNFKFLIPCPHFRYLKCFYVLMAKDDGKRIKGALSTKPKRRSCRL